VCFVVQILFKDSSCFIYIRRKLYVIKVCQTDTYINMYLPIKEVFSCHNVKIINVSDLSLLLLVVHILTVIFINVSNMFHIDYFIS
jgi:hypothetical protein